VNEVSKEKRGDEKFMPRRGKSLPLRTNKNIGSLVGSYIFFGLEEREDEKAGLSRQQTGKEAGSRPTVRPKRPDTDEL